MTVSLDVGRGDGVQQAPPRPVAYGYPSQAPLAQPHSGHSAAGAVWTLVGIAGIIALIVSGWLAWRTYQWKVAVDARLAQHESTLKTDVKNATEAYNFLAGGLPKAFDGKIYNRSQILDALVQRALRDAEAASKRIPAPAVERK